MSFRRGTRRKTCTTCKSGHVCRIRFLSIVRNDIDLLYMKKYLSLVTFTHTIFAMPFAFIGFFLAVTTTHNSFEWPQLAMMVLCMIFARNSAMAFNRYLDRDVDAKNPRTKKTGYTFGQGSARHLRLRLPLLIVFCLLPLPGL